jgi:hypothetical protein
MVCRLAIITPHLLLIRLKNALVKVQTGDMQKLELVLKRYTRECDHLIFKGFSVEERETIVAHLDMAYMLTLLDVRAGAKIELLAAQSFIRHIIMEDALWVHRLDKFEDDVSHIGSLALLPNDIIRAIRDTMVTMPRPNVIMA